MPHIRPVRYVAAIALIALNPLQDTNAQTTDTLRAGTTKFAKLRLHLGRVNDESFLVNNDKTAPGPKSWKETSVVNCGSADCYLVVMVSETPRGSMVDSVWADRQTFALVRHREYGFGNKKAVNVEQGRIKGAAADSGKPVRMIDEAGPAFDFSVVEEIVANLPLKSGYRTVIHSYDITQGFRDVAITVTGEESLPTPAGKRDTYVVELNFGSHKATRWFDKKTGEGLKWRVDMGGGRSMWGQTVR
ncbi:MAG: hypothetical protein ACO1Q7_09580 [Gemmatimonas sp.]